MIIKRLALFFACFVSVVLNAEPLTCDLSAPAAILINANTGRVLFDKHANDATFPASVTKIATALYVCYLNKDLEELITAKQDAIASITPQAKRQSNYRAPPHWLESDGTHMGIKKGEMITLKDLLYGMLVASANDAANVIAQHIGGTIPQFMHDLNKFLKNLGCKNTHFCNPHGLHHPDHITTPYDMALIAKEALHYPFLRQIMNSAKYICAETNMQGPRNLVNTNHLIRQGKYYYPKAIGLKTGYHSAAGKTLVAAAQEENRTLIAVIFGCANVAERYKDATALFEGAFNQSKMKQKLLQKGVQQISRSFKGARHPVPTYLDQDFIWEYFPAEEEPTKLIVHWTAQSLPVVKNQLVGVVRLVNSTQNIFKEMPLYAYEDAKPTLFYRLKATCISLFSKKRNILCCLGGLSILMGLVLIQKRKIKKRNYTY